MYWKSVHLTSASWEEPLICVPYYRTQHSLQHRLLIRIYKNGFSFPWKSVCGRYSRPLMPLRPHCLETWTPSSHVLSKTLRSSAELVLGHMLLNYCARSWYARSSKWPLDGIRSYQGRRKSQRILKRFCTPNNSKILFSSIISVILQKTSHVIREGLSERAHHSTLRMTK